MSTVVQRHATSRALAELLGLDPEQPLVEWHGFTPGHYETPPPPPPPPPAPTGRAYDLFGRPDGALHGSTSDSGHVWSAAGVSVAQIVAGQAQLGMTTNTGWNGASLGGGLAASTADTVTMQFDLTVPNSSAGLWFELLHVNASNSVVAVLTGGNTFLLYYKTSGNLTYTGQAPVMATPLVAGTPRRLAFSYTRSTGVWAVYAAGALVGQAVIPAGVRPALTGGMFNYLQFGNGNIGVFKFDNYRQLDSGPVDDTPVPPPAAPVPVWVPPAWVLDPDRTAALSTYQVGYGRPDPASNIGPTTASVQLVTELAGTTPTAGERFRLTISEPAATALGLGVDDRPRFTGEVTDADVGDDGLTQLVAVGRRARLGRISVGSSAWPPELDGARVARILRRVTDQLPDLDTGTIDAGTAVLLARPAGAEPAAGLLDRVTESTGGQLLEERTGALAWHDADHRRGATPAATLSGDTHLLRPFRWSQGIGDVVNVGRITWGEPASTVRVVDPNSANVDTGLGPLELELSTTLANEADAYARASDLVGRRAWPTWRLPVARVDLVRSAGATRGPLLKLRHGDLVDVSELPADGPYTAAAVFVEGITETFTRTAWQLALSVADQQLAGVAPRWLDVPADVTWDTVDPTLTWLDAATVDPTTL